MASSSQATTADDHSNKPGNTFLKGLPMFLVGAGFALTCGCGPPGSRAGDSDDFGIPFMRTRGAERIEKRLEKLVELASRQWQSGHYLDSLLSLEHACAIVVAYDISEEGGHDYIIKTRVRELFKRKEYALLSSILRKSSHFPQSAQWVTAWAAHFMPGWPRRPGLLERSDRAREEAADVDAQLAELLPDR